MVIERFKIINAKPMCTSLANHYGLSIAQYPKTDVENEEMSKIPYVSTMGCLIYAMVWTRPDLVQADVVRKFLTSPG